MNKNRIINRKTFITNIWESDVIVGERTIDVHIRRLRRKLKDIPIITHKGVGYIYKPLD